MLLTGIKQVLVKVKILFGIKILLFLLFSTNLLNY